MQVTQDATQSAHGSTTGNSEGSSTTTTAASASEAIVSQAPADGKSTRGTEARSLAEHSPALSAADIVNAHTEVVSPSPSVTQTSPVFTAVDSTRQTPAPSPALSAADKEKLRMARINANYEHDKKLLAKEDPAFVRSPFHNIGHAQGTEDLSERDLYKIARELNEEKKEKLRNGR